MLSLPLAGGERGVGLGRFTSLCLIIPTPQRPAGGSLTRKREGR